jgi:hypothetical protein
MLNKKGLFLVAFLLLGSVSLFAQVQPYTHFNELEREPKDTSSIQSFFRRGTLYGHARYFLMATDNLNGDDSYANAFGMGIAYESAPLKGFQFGMSGYFIYNLGSSELDRRNANGALVNRYEVGLFDIENPSSKSDMDRLEDLYLKYTFKSLKAIYGKQHFKSPFINPQDGRMRPTLVQGLTSSWTPLSYFQINAGILEKISPRSTVRWYGIGESIGVYPVGVDDTGRKSSYRNNVNSRFLLYGNTNITFVPWVKLKLWDSYVDNVMNSGLAELSFNHLLNKKESRLLADFMFIRQDRVGQGGNAVDSLKYVQSAQGAMVYSGRLGYAFNNDTRIFLNATRIADKGKYLMPREWGRDPFYTFLPRERNEGYSNLKALTLSIENIKLNKQLKINTGFGYFELPDVFDFERNKYGMPSYSQLNVEFFYTFDNFLKGFEMRLLTVHKMRVGEIYENERFQFNKVNMTNYNLVVNYHF